MTIRRADQKDLNIIHKYAPVVRAEAVYGHTDPSANANQSLVSETVNNGGYYLVDMGEVELRGWIGVGKVFDPNTKELIGFIPEVYVQKAYRRQGIAEKLCRKAITELQTEGLNRVQLQVFAGNPAKKLYQKLGFTNTAVIMGKDI